MVADLYVPDVLDAAAVLVAAFGRCDTEAYFAAFASDASFIFPTDDRVPLSLDEYRTDWDSWIAEGWSVVCCVSTEQTVHLVGRTGAVFTHRVATTVRLASGDLLDSSERETIVFTRDETGVVLATHEHLSSLQPLDS